MTQEEERKCERFCKVRKALKMKQVDFAKELTLTQGHVSDIENKRKSVSDRVDEIICLKFDVNKDWLRNGTGEMFRTVSKNEVIAEFTADVLNDEEESFRRRFLSAIADMNDDGWNALEKLIDDIQKKD